MRPAAKRLAALLVAGVVAATSAPCVPARAEAAGPRVPVVLVPGFSGGPEVWDRGPGGGLRGDLRRMGYEDGVALFALPAVPARGENLAAAARRVGEAVRLARAESGARQVDLVAFGTGALAARFYAEFSAPQGEIRTLAMVAPPIRGSFAADAARVWLFTQALAPEVAASLGAELGRAALASEPDFARADAALGAAAGAEPAGELALQRRLVRELWLPLMAWFVVHRRLLPEDERPPADESFASWLADAAPDLWSRAFAPPEDRAIGAAEVAAWAASGPTAWLAPAYERLLAFQVADLAAAVAQGLADARPPLPGLGEAAGAAVGGLASGDWVSALWHAALAWLVDWAGRAAHALGRPALVLAGRTAGAWAVKGWLGLDAESAALALMVRETVEGAGERVEANRLLAAWNRLAEERADERSTAYVVVRGETLDVWRWLGTEAGANDGVVEVAATEPPAGPLDAYRTVAGLAAASHFALPSSQTVREALLASLDPFRGAPTLADGTARRIEVRAERAGLVRVGSGHAEVAFLAGAGRARAFWISGDGAHVKALRLSDGSFRGEVGDGYLALRLSGSSERKEGAGQASVRWDASPKGAPAAGGGSEDGTLGLGEGGATGVREAGPSERAADGSQGGSAAGAGGAEGASEGAPDGRETPPAGSSEAGPEAWGDLPLIRVILHTRLTTEKRPKVVEHARWHWSFGDGTEADDPDPAHVASEVTHTYTSPGDYTATATSYAADGRVLREIAFPVRVAAPGEAKTFRAQSIRAPEVALSLAGPEAWVAGRPAEFDVSADVVPTDFLESYDVRLDPGPRFLVLWERPGDDFVVRAAATVKVRYAFPDGRALTVYDTYVVERRVDVYATSVVD